VVNVTAGADLHTAAALEGKTYQLAPGDYTISSTILLNAAGTTTCYRGMGSSKAAVNIKVTTTSADNSGRASRGRWGHPWTLEPRA